MSPMTMETTQVHSVYIRSTPQAIWDAITTPEWSNRYGYGGYVEFDGLEPGDGFRVHASEEFLEAGAPDVIVDGEVVEADPPRRLVQTWRMTMDPGMKEEGFTRLTYEIEEKGDQGTKLTIVHELEKAPNLYALVAGRHEDTGAGGGWAWVLSDLKSLLETGSRLAG
jgi:uncharacterized protein YndB with AHSA1/START domain